MDYLYRADLKNRNISIENILTHPALNGMTDVDTISVVMVFFRLEPEARSWGWRGVYCDIIDWSASIEWTASTGTPEEKQGVIELKTGEFEIVNNTKVLEGGQFSINDCNIDFLKKTITFS